MSEDRMQGITRYSPIFDQEDIYCEMVEKDDGDWMKVSDHLRAIQKLREALEEAKGFIENLQLPDEEWNRVLDLVVAALKEAE